MQPYTINPKTRGINGFGLVPPDFIRAVKFDGTAEATLTVPGDLPMGAMGAMGSINPVGNVAKLPKGRNKYIAIFQYGTEVPGDVWVAINATATVPATNAFAAINSQLHPTAYEVFATDVIHAQCSTANQVMSVAFWNIKD